MVCEFYLNKAVNKKNRIAENDNPLKKPMGIVKRYYI